MNPLWNSQQNGEIQEKMELGDLRTRFGNNDQFGMGQENVDP